MLIIISHALGIEAVNTSERPGFTISGTGLALQDGRPGDFIRVRNVDSKRIVVAKVTADGTVAPVIEEKKR